MTTLVQAAVTLRRSARVSFTLAVALGLGVAVALGVFSTDQPGFSAVQLLLAAVWVAMFAQRAQRRLRGEDQGAPSIRHDLELGALLIVGVHAGVQMVGGLTGALYPLVYVLVAFLSSFAVKPAGSVLVLVAVLFEGCLYFVTEGRHDPQPFALHSAFIVFFGLMSLMFTRAEIARVRSHSRRQLDEDKSRALEDARRYRLVGAPSQSAEGDEERLTRSSVEEVHQALYYTLELLKRTLELHTCVLLFLDDSGEQFQIVELVTDSDDIGDAPFAAGSGAVGALARRGMTMNLENIKPGYRGLCYYRGPAMVRAFMGVPVMERGTLRGALCADRTVDRPFTVREEQILEGAVHHILRAIENERVFVQLERSKREQTVLHHASQALGAALTEAAVVDAGLTAAADIAPYDFAAVTLYDAGSRTHRVRRAVGDGAEAFEDLSFRDNTSLTAMAVKNRHYLPYRGEYDGRQQVVYTRAANLPGMQSLLILPLLVREHPVGTLALAAHRRDAFGPTQRPTLQVLANQLAVALANAESVRRLEELATTDGLTGVLNKRAFLDEMENRIKAAERFGRKLSLIISDIDHFKSVNDTYGHATGDVVLRGLGGILRRVKRETDLVARFGGEEFCILCEETDAEGAVLLAERVREELSAQIFQTELGKLRVTTSLGIAQFPDQAKDSHSLFELADKALYTAKQTGRDRVCTARGRAA